MKATHWELVKSGYVRQDGTIKDERVVAKAITRDGIIAKSASFDKDDHFIRECGYELVQGLRVPETGEEIYLNML